MPVHILTLGFSHTGLEAGEWWPGNRIIEETGTLILYQGQPGNWFPGCERLLECDVKSTL